MAVRKPVSGSAHGRGGLRRSMAHGGKHLMDPELSRAIGQIPCGRFILTAAYNDRRTGVLVDWVQQCAQRPLMVVAAVATGLPVVPLIRDSHSFALCQIGADDRLLEKKFATPPAHGDDPFDTLAMMSAPSGSPVPRLALSYPAPGAELPGLRGGASHRPGERLRPLRRSRARRRHAQRRPAAGACSRQRRRLKSRI